MLFISRFHCNKLKKNWLMMWYTVHSTLPLGSPSWLTLSALSSCSFHHFDRSQQTTTGDIFEHSTYTKTQKWNNTWDQSIQWRGTLRSHLNEASGSFSEQLWFNQDTISVHFGKWMYLTMAVRKYPKRTLFLKCLNN